MLDINFIRENTEKVKAGVEAKNLDPEIIDRTLKVDEARRQLIGEIEKFRAERNKLGKEDIEQGRKIKEMLKKLEPDLKAVEEQLQNLLFEIPNPPLSDVKTGANDKENDVIRKVGKIREFDFEVKDYLEIAENLDIIDINRASKVSGARFGYLKGEAVLLELALVNYAMETLTKEKFVPVIPPVMIKKEVMGGMGYLEHGGEEDMYVFDKDGLVLVGTSEQSIGPMYMDEILEEKVLPIRHAGFSTCFRREAGSYGKDTKGIIRVHQFDKIEMFSFTKPEDSDSEHELLLSIEERLFAGLGIPYQVIKMCSGDLGAPAARKYDIEAWMPGQNTYREVTSTSTCTDFQARRLNIRYRSSTINHQSSVQFVHTLNGTAFAIGRTLVAIIENYQQKDGSVEIPKVLQKYTGFSKISPKK